MITFKPIVSTLALVAWIAGAPALHAEDSPQKFVQDFYDWYVPQAKHTHNEDASNVALRKKSAAFSPELLKALKEDAAVSAKSPGEIVGLDYDPFLNSQSTIDRCVVGKVTPKNGAFRVEIYEFMDGKKDKKANVIAEVKQENGHFVFVNIWDPEGNNLVSVLQQLAKDRKKWPKGS